MLIVSVLRSLPQQEAEDQEGPFDVACSPDDLAQANPVEDLIAEETLLDDVDIAGVPQDETERCRAWRKLPQRVRIAVRRLHRAFRHVPKATMVNLLRAEKIKKEFVGAARLRRCDACERTAPKRPTHKVPLPHGYTFNNSVGLDLLKITDTSKYQVLNMVCLGTCFQQAEVVKIGAGQASSCDCMNSFFRRWVVWAGVPVSIVWDRGLHNRGVFQQCMDEHVIQVYHVPLESPESLGRTERHGGLLPCIVVLHVRLVVLAENRLSNLSTRS
jgi:hypothetical protein